MVFKIYLKAASHDNWNDAAKRENEYELTLKPVQGILMDLSQKILDVRTPGLTVPTDAEAPEGQTTSSKLMNMIRKYSAMSTRSWKHTDLRNSLRMDSLAPPHPYFFPGCLERLLVLVFNKCTLLSIMQLESGMLAASLL